MPLRPLVWVHVCFCAPSISRPARPKRFAKENTYDYIIAGGGTSGLIVADRLTWDGKNSVLVIEFGYLNDDINILIPERTAIDDARDAFNWTYIPQPSINNRTILVPAGAVVGGAVNGMLLCRGPEEDYDTWEALGNPGWGWSCRLEISGQERRRKRDYPFPWLLSLFSL